MMTSSDSSQFAPCKYAALREFIFATERKQMAQGILGKVTLTSIVEDFRKANPLAELPCSLLSYLIWDEVLAAVTHNDINMLSMRRLRNPIRDVVSMHDKLRQRPDLAPMVDWCMAWISTGALGGGIGGGRSTPEAPPRAAPPP
jgi:hypothetical protein